MTHASGTVLPMKGTVANDAHVRHAANTNVRIHCSEQRMSRLGCESCMAACAIKIAHRVVHGQIGSTKHAISTSVPLRTMILTNKQTMAAMQMGKRQ